MRSVFAKSLHDQRRAVAGWGIGLALLVLLVSALWPSIRNMPDLDAFLSNYPETMRRLFNLQDFGTGTGFVNAELFSALVPILFLVYGIGRGARAIAGEEESGTLDVLLVTPVTTTRLVLEQAAALLVALLALGGVLYVSVLAGSWAFGMGVSPLSPFDQALSDGPLGAGFRLAYLAMPAAAALFLVAALPVFARRDIAVAH